MRSGSLARRLALLLLLASAWTCQGDARDPQQRGPTGGRAGGRVHAPAARPPPKPAAKPKHPKLRHAKACPPDNARCIALRDHVCDPYYAPVNDTCTFVQFNKHCAEDVHHIAYLPLFYCAAGDGRVLVALFFLGWMAVLFWVMSKAAEDFLVPALEFLAHWMRMAPDVAGVTLFAFASGAPDLFTQIAAVAVGGTVDQELAISATLGGGLFIIAVIFSVVVLAKPRDAAAVPAVADDDGCGGGGAELTDRRAFLRDAVAYALSTVALLCIMLRGVFSAWEAGLMLLGYCGYLAACILTSRRGGGAGPAGVHGRHSYAAVTPSGAARAPRLEAPPFGAAAHEAGQLNGVVVAGGEHDGWQQQQQQQQQQQMVQVELAAWSGGKQQHLGEGEGGELTALVAGQPPSDGAPQPGSARAPPQPGSPAPPAGRGAAWRAKLGGRSAGSLGKALGSVSLGLQEMLHTRGRSGPGMWLTMLMAPAMLLMHATMPALHPGYYTPWYALLLSLCAPLFMLLSTGLYPHHLSADQAALAWLLSALALLALVLLAVPPASPGAGGGAGVPVPGTPPGAVAVVAVAGGSPLAPAPPSGSPLAAAGGGRRAWAMLTGCSGARLRHLCGARRPRRSGVLALLASVQCMLWLSVAADELVSLFEAIGRICDISQDLLGATVLAWGEAVPELVATLTLARQGQATTAIAAAFAGPTFNAGAAWSSATLVASFERKAQPFELSAGLVVLVAATLAVLAFQLAAIPTLFRWRLARNAALGVLAIYGISQLLFLVCEQLW